MNRRRITIFLAICVSSLPPGIQALAEDKPADASSKLTQPQQKQAANKPIGKKQTQPTPAVNLVPLNKQGTVLLDTTGKRLLLKTKVVLREGLLEMFCCLKQTKEHESILAVDAKAQVIHTGLLALGAKPGKPVQYFPKYRPASGQRIDVFVQWSDRKGNPHRERAQHWIRHAIHRFYGEKLKLLPSGLTIPKKSELRYDKKFRELSWYGPMTVKERDRLLALSRDEDFRKAILSFFERSQPRQMEAHWVFAGSGFSVDEKTGRKYYHAEEGDLICVANFASALLDIAVPSSADAAEGLLYETYTERIPPLGTEVIVELVPVPEKKNTEKKNPAKKNTEN